MWEFFYATQVYGGALFHAWDIATDFSVIVYWIEIQEDNFLIIFSVIAVFLYRFISSFVLGRQFGWQWGVLQFLDLTIYVEAYRSLKNKYCVYTRELKWIRRMEAVFESSPQALLQLGFLLKSENILQGKVTSFDTLVIISFLSSLASIAFSVARDDEAYFEIDAAYFMVPVWKSKFQRNNKSKKQWVAMHELKNCYEDENYIPDTQTIWIMNWKYIIRFVFRLCEVSGRILTISCVWMAFGGAVLICVLSAGFLFYFCLQLSGLIGHEWGNMVTFLVAHPNLTLKTDFETSRRPNFAKFVTFVSGWYVLNSLLKYDMVETHYIHRAIETAAELFAICIGIYALDCCGVIEVIEDTDTAQEIINTKDVFFKYLGIGIYSVSWICCIATPLLLRNVSKWLKKGKSLENNLFGLINTFEKAAVREFLEKSNRSEQLINSQNNRGYTPLSLAAEIGFYDIFGVLLEFGADINGTNKKGETVAHRFAKIMIISKKNMHRGLNLLKKLNADFSIIDKQGWSPAFHACEIGNIKFIDWLCKYDADALTAKDFDERSISHIASVHNQDKFLQKLDKLKKTKKLKSDLFAAKDENGRIPLHYAFEYQSPECVIVLLKKNKDFIHFEDNQGETPLNAAAQYCQISFFQQLKQLQWTSVMKWRTFLNAICSEGNLSLLKWILRECQRNSKAYYKSLSKYKDQNQRNPVHYCCMHGNDKLIPALTKYKFPVDDTDIKGRTPGYFAAQRGHIRCLRALAKCKANFKIMSTNRVKPIDIASQNGHDECVKYLLQFDKVSTP